jgi:biopolymer transport protein ExbD
MASNANKRKRKRKHLEDETEPEFQVAPMIDVLLVLTLFFMSITSSELLKKKQNLTLPDASQAKPESGRNHSGQIVINVSWDHMADRASFDIDGRTFPDATSITNYVARQVAANPQSYALVRADKDTEYSNISDVMGACAAAGISKVSFAVITSGNLAHKGAVQAATPAPGT